jgi:type II secretory pathway pseudopilin PulG
MLEVLFAVLILGIGLILIAAIFPAAVRQTRASVDETKAASLARGAVSTLAEAGRKGLLVPNNHVTPLPPKAWLSVSGDLILPSDPAYAWVPLYRTELDTAHDHTNVNVVAQVLVIAVRNRNRPVYAPQADLLPNPSTGLATLQPRPVTITLTHGSFGTDLVTFENGTGQSAAEGAYLIRDDGQLLRLGNVLIPQRIYQLAPETPLSASPLPQGGIRGEGYLVGRGYDNPAALAPTYAGPAQDIAAYTTVVPVLMNSQACQSCHAAGSRGV